MPDGRRAACEAMCSGGIGSAHDDMMVSVINALCWERRVAIADPRRDLLNAQRLCAPKKNVEV